MPVLGITKPSCLTRPPSSTNPSSLACVAGRRNSVADTHMHIYITYINEYKYDHMCSAGIYTHTSTHALTHTYMHAYRCTCTHMPLQTHMHMCIHMYTDTCIPGCVHVLTNMYAHRFMHTHIVPLWTLLASGSSDPQNPGVPLLSSPTHVLGSLWRPPLTCLPVSLSVHPLAPGQFR